MVGEEANGRLHLPDLLVTGFRGIERLSIPRLGRVTLLAGRNGAGKTTVLDAVRVYAGRGRAAVLRELLDSREESAAAYNDSHDPVDCPDFAALFHGRTLAETAAISIGPVKGTDSLGLEPFNPRRWATDGIYLPFPMGISVRCLKIVHQGREWFLPWILSMDDQHPVRLPPGYPTSRVLDEARGMLDENEWPPAVACESLGPGLLSSHDMARFWDNVVLTDAEDLSIRALRLVLRDEVSRVAVIGEGGPRSPRNGRRVVARLPGLARAVPLRSLGDGVTRMFGVALALTNSRNGFLTIDEAETGIHYSLQSDFWRMVLQAADEYNVQVLATTHSGDCVKGFARAASGLDGVEGVLVRLEREAGRIRAIAYSEEELETAADQGIEVR